MAENLVKFWRGSRTLFDAKTTKDNNTIYFVTETDGSSKIYRGSVGQTTPFQVVTAYPTTGMVAGTLYINSANSTAKFYAGGAWHNLGNEVIQDISSHESDSNVVPSAKAVVDYFASKAIGVAGSNAISVTGDGLTKTIALKINGNDKVLSASDSSGLLSTLSIKKITTGISDSTVNVRYQLVGKDGSTALGASIDIYKDRFIKKIEYTTKEGKPYLVITYVNEKGVESEVDIPLEGLVDVYDGRNGVKSVKNASDSFVYFEGVVDANSEKLQISDSTVASILSVGADGFKLDNLAEAIAYKVNKEVASEASLRSAADTELSNKIGTKEDSESAQTVYGAIKAEAVARAGADDAINTKIGQQSDSTSTTVYGYVNSALKWLED